MGQSARNAAIGVNAVDLSTYFKGIDSTWQIDLEDSTTFSSTRTAKSWTLLLEESVLSLTGFWDSTATVGVNAVLRAALAAATKAIVTVWPVGDAVGAVGIGLQADESSRKVTIPVDGVIGIAAEFKSSVGEEDVVCLHPLTQETADGNGTTVNNGAATTNGGSAFLECSDVATSNAVTLRHSTDNFAADDTLLGTFTTVVADRTSQRIELSGTIKQYVREAHDLTGGNSTFRVSLCRK